MILFNDSEWKYNFVILMILIIVVCGLYTLFKILKQKKKEENISKSPKKNKWLEPIIRLREFRHIDLMN